MRLQVFKSLWGMDGPLDQSLDRIKAAGYDGVEAGFWNFGDHGAFRRALARRGLKLIGMVFTAGPDHRKSFADQLKAWRPFHPVSVTCHSLTDDTPPAEQLAFYHEAVRIEHDAGIPVGHETHRGRAFFTPWTTATALRAVPGLSVTADFSHWTCACESDLARNGSEVRLACERAVHVHTRVGYDEGPQVPDPRAPEWRGWLARHEGWWKAIWKARKRAGAKVMTADPEFGPPDYLHTLPHTRQPVADLWDICLWMATRLRTVLR